jgi:hypothetical protein
MKVEQGKFTMCLGKQLKKAPSPDGQTTEPNQKVKIKRMSERGTWTSFLSLRTDVCA